jgi:predicted regulator of Ras-like GTPase activity (Roadblock/LC7/MglB family)
MLKRGVASLRLMLEPQAKNIIELEGMSGLADERKPLIQRIMRDSRGWIDAVIMVVNGVRIAFTENGEVNVNNVASAACTIADAALAVLELFGSRKINEMDIRMLEGWHLIIRDHDGCRIAILTKPNPNLGLIKLALEKNLASNKHVGKIMHAIQKMASSTRIE